MVKVKHRRNQAYQDVRLVRAASAAGLAFGLMEPEPTNAERIAALRAMRLMVAVFVPMALVLPLAAVYSFGFVS
ncbi:MAG TPA: hypothetical protein PLQ11_10580 [Beijerinckiaceae bacterium]|nr:hypothetical protein [Beijerinckiaceae bacterium]